MRYLRSFNEGKKEEDLQDFCETNLAYLLDNGFYIRVVSRAKGFLIEFMKGNPELNEDVLEVFNWDDIKDYYIPFYQILTKNYISYPYYERDNVVEFCYKVLDLSLYNSGQKSFNSDDIIEDNISNTTVIDRKNLFSWRADRNVAVVSTYVK